MMDALGFKGIWRRHAPADVIAKLRALEKATASVTSPMEADDSRTRGHHRLQVRTSVLSDTLVVGVAFDPKTRGDRTLAPVPGHAIIRAASIGNMLLRRGGEGKVRFAYRGAIAFGDFEVTDRFVVGAAVDEAAEAYEQAEGAFVWLTPSAERALGGPKAVEDQDLMFLLHRTLLVPWKVPLKGGRYYRTHVVNPLFSPLMSEHRRRREQRMRNILGTFSDSLDVAIKRQHTEAYLSQIHDHYTRHEEKLARKRTQRQVRASAKTRTKTKV